MAESDGQERTEEATPKRQEEAREKGQIARSRELGTAAMLLTAGALFAISGQQMIADLATLVEQGLTLTPADLQDPQQLPYRFMEQVGDVLLSFAPFFGAMFLVAIISGSLLGGWSFSTEALSFKVEKLDPIKGMGRVFSWRGLVEMVKGLLKFLLVGVVAIAVLRAQQGALLGLAQEPLQQGMAHMGNLLVWAFLIISASLLLVVAIDVPFQLWDHARQLKMTKQEIREEHKQSEGSPEVKGRQRRIQMEMAQRRMMAEVPKADVVITNPTHYAVALRYDQNAMNAPILVAKGSDLVAAQIRKIAQESGVPVLSAPPLCRAIFHNTELDQPIPAGLYRAVAQVLAYVYHLRQGPIYNRSGVDPLADLPIPDELRRDE